MRTLASASLLVLVSMLCSCKSGAPPADSTPASAFTAAKEALRPSGKVDVPEGGWPHERLGIEIIDSHVHIVPTMTALAQALEIFDRLGIRRFVSKSGGVFGEPRFRATVAMKRVLGDRFEWFCNIDWDDIDDPKFGARTAAKLARAVALGAKGVKIFKALGLSVRTEDGKLVPVDDPRLDPIFDKAAELGFIVAMHTADPVAFFEPPTPDNERYDELKIAKSWSFYGKDYPSHAELLAQRDRLIARHPQTIFLLIHLANDPEDLDYVDKLLDTYPNVWVDTSARVPEIGRHDPAKVRAFFVKHQDRILFGSDFISSPHGMQLGSVWHLDTPPTLDDAVAFFERHWAFFETDRRKIQHPTPIQGRWTVDAIGLPPETLEKFLHDNAEWLIFSPTRPLAARLKSLPTNRGTGQRTEAPRLQGGGDGSAMPGSVMPGSVMPGSAMPGSAMPATRSGFAGKP